jgi:ABC-type Fe3+-hydroxamate transport system substrate-binding protein
MKRKIFSQISLLLALFIVAISLSACSSQSPTVSASSTASSVTYSQNVTQNSNIPSPQTRQS